MTDYWSKIMSVLESDKIHNYRDAKNPMDFLTHVGEDLDLTQDEIDREYNKAPLTINRYLLAAQGKIVTD